MSKQSGNIEIEGEIDAGFTSYYDAETHGSQGQTVAGTSPDDEGDERTVDWPSAVDADPEDLTDTEEQIIRAAARYPDASNRRLADIVDCSIDYPRQVLKEQWPDRHHTKEHYHQQGAAFDAADVANIRRLLLAGASTTDIADKVDVDQGTISRYARGKKTVDPDDPPAIEYNGSEWVIPSDTPDDMADTPETETETEAETERVEHETDTPNEVTVPAAALEELDRTLTTAERIGTDGQVRLSGVVRNILPEIEEVSADGE